MNTKGEWVIEPKYRSVTKFSEGVAIVETIEEDRDHLANSRQIAIDIKGNELFEIKMIGLDLLIMYLTIII